MASGEMGDVWLWDNIELLFLPELQVDVLPWLKRCARLQPLVVAWPGEYRDGHLIFSRIGRDDYYRSERDSDILVHPVLLS
jgi:hypothetical protein